MVCLPSPEQQEYDDLCVAISKTPDDDDAIRMIDAWIRGKGAEPAAKLLLATYQSVRPFADTGRFGATLLHMVCDMKLTRAFDHVLSLNSDPDFLDKKMDDGSTALHLCAIRNCPAAMTRRLIECGADCFAIRDMTRANAFYLACECHNLESAKFLLHKMLATLGISETATRLDPDDLDAVRQIVVLPGIDSTVLHASVVDGKGDEVCRWLTGPECRILWTGFPCDYLGKHGKYGRTVLMECLRAKQIHMPTIQFICGLYDPPITATVLLTSYLEGVLLSAKNAPRPASVMHQIIEFLYEQASTRPDFDTSGPQHQYPSLHAFALKLILKHLPGSFAASPSSPASPRSIPSDVASVVSLVERLVAKYPEHLTPETQSLAVPARLDPVLVSVLIMLDLFPCPDEDLRSRCYAVDVIYDLRSLLAKDIVARYIRNLKARGRLCTLFLYDVMALGGCSDFWIQFVEAGDSHTLHSELETVICMHDSFCPPHVSVNHIRFMAWLHKSRYPTSLRRSHAIEKLLSRCRDAHRLVPALLSHHIIHIDGKTVRALGLSIVRQISLLKSVLWHSDLRPTQVCTCLIAEVVSNALSCTPLQMEWFMAELVWIYNLRTMIRERATIREPQPNQPREECRIILGPRRQATPPPQPLPVPVTQTILEFLWQGSSLDSPASLSSFMPVIRTVGGSE